MDEQNRPKPQTDDRDRVAAQFERHRGYLRAVAYRMLGSVTEADDAVQESWLRIDRRPPDEDALRPWLTVVVSRICIDMLRARRARRETYGGTWLPEPVVSASEAGPLTPEREVLLADSIGVALLVVLESLTPAERVAFVLHDVFGLPFEQVGEVVGRTPVATRQLASRARRRVMSSEVEPDADIEVQRNVVTAFLSAARNGEFDALLRLLDPDATFRTDGGGEGALARPPVRGRESVVEVFRRQSPRFAHLGRIATVNGRPGILVADGTRVIGVVAFGYRGGRIHEIDLIADPAKLRLVQVPPES